MPSHARPPALQLGHEGRREVRGRLGPRGQLCHGADYTAATAVRTSSRTVVVAKALSPTLSFPTKTGIRLAVLLDERQHAAPGVVAGVLPFRKATVEEAVRRAVVDMHLVRHFG